MRKISVVIAAALIFLIACYILYTSLDASINKRRSDYEKDKKELEELDRRMKSLQDDIHRNGRIIDEIKRNLYKLGKQPVRKPDAVGPTERQYGLEPQPLPTYAGMFRETGHSTKENTSMAKTAEFDHKICALADSNPADVDVQMLNVYELLKFDNPDGGVWKQGWDITYDKRKLESDSPKLQVFVVPHSHCDPGWIKTFEAYYLDQTRHILDNMVQKLSSEPRMKFIYAEISFFERWWRDTDDSKRSLVKKFLQNGQLEIVTGAWVMTDEANSHFYATIDQIIEGNQWVFNHLGFIPKHHWSIDPFGLTPTMAYLMKLSNFSAMAVQRVHYSVKKYLAKQKHLEFFWRQLWSSKSQSDLLCHVFPFYSYDVPHTCGPEPKICCQFDFKRLPGNGVGCPWNVAPIQISDSNVHERSATLLDQYRKKAQLYKANVLLVPLGDDFRYDTSVEWDHQFENYQRLFDYMNLQQGWNVEAKFGTLSDYFSALSVRLSDADFPVLTGDFFTYADRDDHYWSGYYTTRPFYKRMDRVLQRYLRAAEIVFSVAWRLANSFKSLFAADQLFPLLVNARRNMALFQHHDGVSGTAKDHVMVDYGQRMHQSIEDCRTIMSDSIRLILTKETDEFKSDLVGLPLKFTDSAPQFDSIPEKIILFEDGSQQNIVVYNSLSIDRDEFVCIHSSTDEFVVKDAQTDQLIPTQVNPVIFKDRNRMEISATIFEVCWHVNIMALSFRRYILSAGSGSTPNDRAEVFSNFVHESGLFEIKKFDADTFQLQTNFLSATFSSATGYLKTLSTQYDRNFDVNLSFVKYGTVEKKDQSGAYLFLPDGQALNVPSIDNKVILIRGHLFSTVIVVLAQVQHTIRICNMKAFRCQALEIHNLIDIKQESNYELVMRINSGINNEDKSFFTDLNGFQIIKRKYFDKIPLQGNVYPMPTAAFIEDRQTRLTLLSGQPNGVASTTKGSLEVFLDRRLMQDDNRGLFQTTTDNKVTPSFFRLTLESMSRPPPVPDSKSGFHTMLAHLNSLALLHPLFLLYERSLDLPTSTYLPSRKMSPAALPCDVHLVTLRTMEQIQTYGVGPGAIRNYPDVHPKLEQGLILHRVALDCRSSMGPFVSCSAEQHQQISILHLFVQIKVVSVEETSLNMIHSKRRLLRANNFSVRLEPMELGTYRIT